MRFIFGEPAIFHKDALIIGDTHFGIEFRLKEKGIHYEGASEQILEKIISLVKKTKAKKLIMIGDVKECITHVDKITENVFKKLQTKVPITIVRGNHDGGIEKICDDVKPSEGFFYEGLGLMHGNAWPSEELVFADYLVSAHQHPQIELKDKLGKIHVEPAWFVLPPNKTKIKNFYKKFNKKIQLILLPAFNTLVGKSLKLNAEKHIGPLLYNRLFKLNDALVYRLNGICLGKLKNIEV